MDLPPELPDLQFQMSDERPASEDSARAAAASACAASERSGGDQRRLHGGRELARSGDQPSLQIDEAD
jgi:hypothetical protein